MEYELQYFSSLEDLKAHLATKEFESWEDADAYMESLIVL